MSSIILSVLSNNFGVLVLRKLQRREFPLRSYKNWEMPSEHSRECYSITAVTIAVLVLVLEGMFFQTLFANQEVKGL